MRAMHVYERAGGRILCLFFGLIGVAVTGQTTTPASNGSDQGTIWVHYELSKREYLLAEPIFLGVSVENYGNKTVCFDPKSLRKLQLRNGQGETEKFKGTIWEDGRAKLVGTVYGPCGCCKWELKAEERTVVHRGNLLDDYGEGVGGRDYYLTPGKYTVTADSLPSDTVVFRVVEPGSGNDSSAAALLMHIADHRYELAGSYEQMYHVYTDFVRTYPNSIYTAGALAHLLSIFPGDPPEYTKAEEQYYAQAMITQYPTSDYFYAALLRFDASFAKPSEKRSIMDGLCAARARIIATDLQKRIDELLELLKK